MTMIRTRNNMEKNDIEEILHEGYVHLFSVA